VSGRILLIGGTGFLGSFVAARLAARPIAALVRPTSNRAYLPDGMPVCLGDLDGPLLLEGSDTLVYCASMGFGHIPPLMKTLEASAVKRAVLVSTTAIFTSLPAPSRTVRLDAEAAVQDSSLDWTIVRPTMIYGTERDRNISRLLRHLRRWPVFPLCGNGLWQPVHVEDVADAVVSALDSPSTVGRAYNLPGAAPLRFTELIRTAAQAVGRRHVLQIPVPISAAALAARLTRVVTPEQVHRLAEDKTFDYAAATRDFNYHPRTFKEGVAAEARLLFSV
jgi:nucleoside-diphosphate-sugar epimerase